MKDNIAVSVCIVTYNQEDYIAQCLASFVEQETNFKFEVIVGEDCSTDKTRSIIEDFYHRYPDIIVPVLRDENVGPVANIRGIYAMARGAYICHVDGDDYALPGKLQAQYDILMDNPDCVICSHDMEILNAEGIIQKRTFRRYEEGVHTLRDLYCDLPFFSHSSKMFVNYFPKEYFIKINKEALDIDLHVAQAKNGNIYHLDKVLGGYRMMVGISNYNGVVNPIFPRAKIRIYEAALSDGLLPKRYIKQCYAKAMANFCYTSVVYGDIEGIKKYARLSLGVTIYSMFQLVFCSLALVMPRTVLMVSVSMLKVRNKLKQWR